MSIEIIAVVIIIILVVIYFINTSNKANNNANDDVKSPVNDVKSPVNDVKSPVNNPINNTVNSPVNNTGTTDIAYALANAQNSAKALYDALQAAYAQLQRDAMTNSAFMSFVNSYIDVLYTGSSWSPDLFPHVANDATTIIRQVNNELALPGCRPQSSQCGYYTMIMSASSLSSLSSLSSSDIPTLLAPLKKPISDCYNFYTYVQFGVDNAGKNPEKIGPETIRNARGYIDDYNPNYYAAITNLVVNFDSLVNNATHTGQILARMLT